MSKLDRQRHPSDAEVESVGAGLLVREEPEEEEEDEEKEADDDNDEGYSE